MMPRDFPQATRRTSALRCAHHDESFTQEECALTSALDAYKRLRGHPHPSWREVLGVALDLGYRLPVALGWLKEYLQFGRAMEAQIKSTRNDNPNFRDVLNVLHALGYTR
jgi:hypothetical protein